MEHRRQRLATWATYLRRQLYFLLAAVVLIGLSLTIGTLGYMFFAHYGAADAFLNASMILSGMGPLGALPGDDAKWFASAYALFSGIALPTIQPGHEQAAVLVRVGLHVEHQVDVLGAATIDATARTSVS